MWKEIVMRGRNGVEYKKLVGDFVEGLLRFGRVRIIYGVVFLFS